MNCISATSRPFFSILRLLSLSHCTFSSNHGTTTKQSMEAQAALKLLHLVTPQTTDTQNHHLRLIQSCMQDLLVQQSTPYPNYPQKLNFNITPNVFDEILDRDVCWGSLFFQMHKDGMKAEASTLSCALSSCGSLRSLKRGVQLHCLSIKTGFDLYVYVGSSLISLYGKCGYLEDAYRVFEEMPVRNVVSWTAIIAGFAQHWQVEMCLKLYHRMRCSTSKPNDITFTSILSACTGSGSLGQGRSAHCQTIQMGFDPYIHIANALISMYSKCGNVEDAVCIFEKLRRKDLISWNSMIVGYAHHGFAEQAINMVNEMEKQKIRPDGITFLGVLSSCRHAGFIEQGRLCFNSMIQHGVEPDLDHYSCIVDLLGRAGLLEEAKEFIDKMPICANAVIWGSLLSSCRLHGDVQSGIEAAENRLLLDPECAATHVQLVNLYASAGCWDQAARVRKLMKDRGLKTNPGYSWIEIRNEVYRFRAEDSSNARVDEILAVVDSLVDNMISFGYVPRIHGEGFDP